MALIIRRWLLDPVALIIRRWLLDPTVFKWNSENHFTADDKKIMGGRLAKHAVRCGRPTCYCEKNKVDKKKIRECITTYNRVKPTLDAIQKRTGRSHTLCSSLSGLSSSSEFLDCVWGYSDVTNKSSTVACGSADDGQHSQNSIVSLIHTARATTDTTAMRMKSRA